MEGEGEGSGSASAILTTRIFLPKFSSWRELWLEILRSIWYRVCLGWRKLRFYYKRMGDEDG